MTDSTKKPSSAIDMKQLNELAKWLETTGLEEVEIESAGTRLRLRKPGATNFTTISQPLPQAALQNTPQSAAPEASMPDSAATFKSPMVGTFYRANSPDSPSLVKEGDIVSVGQVLGIIEAMKTMNQIESDRAGTVSKVLVTNAQAVEYGQPLFIIQ